MDPRLRARLLKRVFIAVAGLFCAWWVLVIFSGEGDRLRWSGIPILTAFVSLGAALLILGKRTNRSARRDRTVTDEPGPGTRLKSPGAMLQLSGFLIALSWAWFSFFADGAPAWQLFLAVMLSIVIPMLVYAGGRAARRWSR